MSTSVADLLKLRAQILQNMISQAIQRFESMQQLLEQNPQLARGLEKQLIDTMKEIHGILRMLSNVNVQELEKIMSPEFIREITPSLQLLHKFMHRYLRIAQLLKTVGGSKELEELASKIVQEFEELRKRPMFRHMLAEALHV